MTLAQNRTKILSAILAILIAFILLSVVIFIVSEEGHECVGDDCELCHVLDCAQKIVEGLTTVGVAVLATLALRYATVKTEEWVEKSNQSTTLISLKVKLSD
ncbi:MAG: hypothetical protein J1F36_04040 [Clostridiales bacterium]|nr:hypothetical protein [Clostridiales bacterium]